MALRWMHPFYPVRALSRAGLGPIAFSTVGVPVTGLNPPPRFVPQAFSPLGTGRLYSFAETDAFFPMAGFVFVASIRPASH